MSGFTCEQSTDLRLFGTDVHILGYSCDDQWGAFATVLLCTLIIKLSQKKLYAEITQKQRQLLQMPKGERWGPSTFTSPMFSMLMLEFIATVISILSVLVIMGVNFWIFVVIIVSNIAGSAWTFAHMEMDHHSVAKDWLNLLEQASDDVLKTTRQNCVNKESRAAAQKALRKLKEALDNMDNTMDVVNATVAPPAPGFIF